MSWRYACSFQGKEKTLSIGTWPEVSLAEARTAYAEARRLLASGISPADAKREAKLAAPRRTPRPSAGSRRTASP
jgi:hypothetical protein